MTIVTAFSPASIVAESTEMRQCPLPTPTFTGRKDVLLQMDGCFFDGTKKQHTFVLHGLGGSGKSQIVYKFVERCDERDNNERYVSSTNHYFIISSDIC